MWSTSSLPWSTKRRRVIPTVLDMRQLPIDLLYCPILCLKDYAGHRVILHQKLGSYFPWFDALQQGLKITLHQKLRSYFFHSSMLNKQHGLKITLHQKLMGYFSIHVVQRSAARIKKYFTSKAEELFFQSLNARKLG